MQIRQRAPRASEFFVSRKGRDKRGCDIHAHIEIKVADSWHYYAPADIWRNYTVFSKMAGVRAYNGSPEPMVEPRGFPENASFTTWMHREDEGLDGHTDSWLTLDEIDELIKWFDEKLGYRPWGCRLHDQSDQRLLKWNEFGVWLFGNSICGFKDRVRGDYPDALQDVRLVFWFDN